MNKRAIILGAAVIMASAAYFTSGPQRAVSGDPQSDQSQQLAHAEEQVARVTKKAAEEETLTALMICQPEADCSQDYYQKVWLKIEVENGEVVKIDTKSIQHYNTGAAEVVVYRYVPGTNFEPENMRRLFFDCAHHYRDDTDGFSAIADVPPRSIAGAIERVACPTK